MSDATPALKRYVLCPGVVEIAGKKRYFSAPELARRYHVEMSDCVVFTADEETLPATTADPTWLLPDPSWA